MDVRFRQHRNSAMNGGSELPVHFAWRKYGEPEVKIICDSFATQDELHLAEIEAIKETLSPNGYNLAHGGETAPSKNPEVARKISLKGRGRKIDNKERRSEIATELWERPEYREKMSQSLKNAWTDDMRKERGEKMELIWAKRKSDGFAVPESTKEKLRNYERTSSTRKKMSLSAKKRINENPISHSKDTKKKISEKTKEMWADPIKAEARRQKLRESWARRKELSKSKENV